MAFCFSIVFTALAIDLNDKFSSILVVHPYTTTYDTWNRITLWIFKNLSGRYIVLLCIIGFSWLFAAFVLSMVSWFGSFHPSPFYGLLFFDHECFWLLIFILHPLHYFSRMYVDVCSPSVPILWVPLLCRFCSLYTELICSSSSYLHWRHLYNKTRYNIDRTSIVGYLVEHLKFYNSIDYIIISKYIIESDLFYVFIKA